MKQFDAPKKKNSKETDSGMDEEGDELTDALDELEEEVKKTTESRLKMIGRMICELI
jgi:hypothetical protein